MSIEFLYFLLRRSNRTQRKGRILISLRTLRTDPMGSTHRPTTTRRKEGHHNKKLQLYLQPKCNQKEYIKTEQK